MANDWSQTITPCETEMINFISKHFLLYVWTAVNKVRIFSLQRFVINTMANSQSWQNLAAGSVNSASPLSHISDLRWNFSSTFDRKEKIWGFSDSKITDSLHYFITNAQIGDMLLFCYDYKTTVFRLLVVC